MRPEGRGGRRRHAPAPRQVTIESGGKTPTSAVDYSPRAGAPIVTMIKNWTAPPASDDPVLMAEGTQDDRFELGWSSPFRTCCHEHAFVGNNGTIQAHNFDFIGGTDLGAPPRGLGGVTSPSPARISTSCACPAGGGRGKCSAALAAGAG